MRLNIIQIVVFLLLGMIICSLFYMQIIRGGYYHLQSTNNRIRVVPYDGPRGRILDRNGLVLADNSMAFHVAIVPQDIEDKDILFKYLGVTLGKDPLSLEHQFDQRKRAPFAPVILTQDISRQDAVKIEEEKFIFPGLIVQQSYERIYPFGENGAHVLGHVGRVSEEDLQNDQSYGFTPLSQVGKTGIEKQYENYLQAIPGGRQIEVDSRGTQVRLLGYKDPVPGQDVVLTIDQRLQNAAQELLKDSRGGIVVMDMNNGDLLASVSSPSYDPDAFSDRTKSEALTGYFNDPSSPLLNRVISGLYPPGSVFKIPVALAAIQLHKITPDTTFECPGYMMVGKRKFRCAHTHGIQDLTQAIAHSCNVYFFHVGLLVTPPVIGAYAKAFGLSKRTGVDLPYEVKGQIITKATLDNSWFTGDVLNLSIGQGYTLVTPLQMIKLMAAVANNGIMITPRITQQVGDVKIPVIDNSRRPLIHLRNDSWEDIQRGLKSTVDDPEGTGHDLQDVPNLSIYGKTGTAQSVHGKPDHAWFVGYTKSPKRPVVFCVFIEYGGSSENAVRITRDLLFKMQALEII